MNSTYFKERVLAKINKYSAEVDYVIKVVEVQKENSSEYCVDLNTQRFISKYKNLSSFLFSTHDLKRKIERIDCIDKIDVRKTFPSKIKLIVSYKMPVAIWQENKIFYFVTALGEVMKIRSNKNLNKFIVITGNSPLEHVKLLLQLMYVHKDIYAKVSMAVWVGDRRWNIIFNNGTKLMLPEDHPENAWNKFMGLHQMHADFKNLKYKTVDLRVSGKIYVQ